MTATAIVTRLQLRGRLQDAALPELLDSLGAARRRPEALEVVERAAARAQRVVSRFRLAPDTCLYRALVRYALLTRAGYPVRFVMALDRTRDALEGHAWVELGGEPLGETIAPSLAVTFVYPGPRR